MSLLAPLYALGLAAIALPVLFHLARQTARRRHEFAATMFLDESRPPIVPRRSIEDRLLLALRASALMLLCAAFARPFVEGGAENTAQPPRRLAILIDSSASMRRGDLWTQAIARAETALAELEPQDRAAIYLFDDVSRCIVPFTNETERDGLSAAREALRELRNGAPGWGGTDLGAALSAAIGDITQRAAVNAARDRVLVVSDMQESARLQRIDWPRHVELRVAAVSPASATNAGLALVASGAESHTGDLLRVRVTNAARSDRDRFRLQWCAPDDSPLGPPIDAYVPPGGARVLSVASPPAHRTIETIDGSATAGSPARLVLTGDDHEFDNTLHVLPLEQRAWQVVFAGDSAADDSRGERYYIERAFPDTPLRRIDVVELEPHAPALSAAARDVRLAVVCAPLSDEHALALRRYVAAGGTVLVAATSAEMEATLRALIENVALRVTEDASGGDWLLAGIDFTHPLFVPFADARYSDFNKVHFWRRWLIELPESLPAHVLARFEDGPPAIVEVPRGGGRFVLIASGWRPADSQLALSSKFVPLLERLLELSGGPGIESKQIAVGEQIRLAHFTASEKEEIEIVSPAAGAVRLVSGERSFAAGSPGVFAVVSVTEPERLERVAVNVPPQESRTDPMSTDRLIACGLPVDTAGSTAAIGETDRAAELPAARNAAQRALRRVESEARQKLWRWLLAGAVGVLIVETWVAARRPPIASSPISESESV